MLNKLEERIDLSWKTQQPYINKTVSREEFDSHITSDEFQSLKSKLIEDGKLCLQIFKNAYIIIDLAYGGACNSCNNDVIALYFEEDFNKEDYKNSVTLPGLEAFIVRGFAHGDHVAKISDKQLKNKQVTYRCLNCSDNKWYYITYDSVFGLTYSTENVN